MPNANDYRNYLGNRNAQAFLNTIAWAEGGKYNNVFGGGTFSGVQHPNRLVRAGGYSSTAAGRYQFLYSTWIEIKNRLGLADFSPQNQDIAALDLINQRGALGYVLNGQLEQALKKLGCAWAALPYSGCNQPQKSYNATLNYYNSQTGNNAPVINNAPVNNLNNALANLTTSKPKGEQNNTLYYILGLIVLAVII